MSTLEVRDLCVDLNTRGQTLRIVDRVSLKLRRGATLGLVGESGSGKSTVANAILRLLPTRSHASLSGSIRLGDTELLTLPAAAMRGIRGRRIAMIPQDPMSSLNPLFTIGSQIAEALTAHGAAARQTGHGDTPGKAAVDPTPATTRNALRQTILELLRRVRIDSPETRIDQYPHELSGGMRQRVVGAIAIACGAEFLLADEPTTALDVTVQAQYLDMLMDLQRDTHMGVLFITHDLGVIARICTDVAVMYAGRIVESGPVDAIFAEPRHWYTRALLDSLPGNASAGTRLASIKGTPLRPGTAIAGCRFAPRCPAARDACGGMEPALAPAARNTESPREHRVRCRFPIAANHEVTA